MRHRAAASAPLVDLVEELLHPGTRPKLRVRDADDLLQDALLLFVERHERIPQGSWRAWIFGTLRNRERELFKKQALWKKYKPLLEAHVQEHAPWGEEPDVAIRQQQVLFALIWLLDQVEPSRRDVAERCLFDDVSLAAIAAETGLPLGTVRSQWTRAKREMRLALDRERARLDDVFVAIMLAILGAWFLWIEAHVRRTAAALAAPFEPARRPAVRRSATARGRRPSSPRAARERHAATSRRRRSRAGAAAACALLPLWMLRHTTADALDSARVATAAGSFEAIAGTLTSEVPPESDTAHDDDLRGPAPVLTTNVERKRKAGTQPAVPRARPAGASGRSADEAPVAAAEREVGRALLNRANTALEQGHENIARDALRLYDDEFRDNPFPALRAQVAAALDSRRQP